VVLLVFTPDINEFFLASHDFRGGGSGGGGLAKSRCGGG